MAFVHWNLTADRPGNSGTFFMIFIISIGNLDSVAFLFRLIPALLFRNLLAALSWFLPALLSRLIPALLSGFIPALLLTVDSVTFSFSDSFAFSLCNSATLLNSGGRAFLFISGAALALSGAVTLL